MEAFSADGFDREATGREFGWAANDFVIITMGRLSAEKGQEYLLDAIGEVARVMPETRLAVISSTSPASCIWLTSLPFHRSAKDSDSPW